MHNSKKNRVIRREQKIVEEDMQSITNTMMYQCQESVMIQPNLNLPIIFLLIKYATWTLSFLFCNAILHIQLPKFYYIFLEAIRVAENLIFIIWYVILKRSWLSCTSTFF